MFAYQQQQQSQPQQPPKPWDGVGVSEEYYFVKVPRSLIHTIERSICPCPVCSLHYKMGVTVVDCPIIGLYANIREQLSPMESRIFYRPYQFPTGNPSNNRGNFCNVPNCKLCPKSQGGAGNNVPTTSQQIPQTMPNIPSSDNKSTKSTQTEEEVEVEEIAQDSESELDQIYAYLNDGLDPKDVVVKVEDEDSDGGSSSSSCRESFMEFYPDTGGESPSTTTTTSPTPKLEKEGNKGPMHICAQCGLSYRTLSKIKAHLKLHEIPKGKMKKTWRSPHICPTCGKEYVRKESYSKHVTSCQGLPHMCPRCGKEFARPSALQNHLERAHSAPKEKWTCGECGEKLPTHYQLFKHMKFVHYNIF